MIWLRMCVYDQDILVKCRDNIDTTLNVNANDGSANVNDVNNTNDNYNHNGFKDWISHLGHKNKEIILLIFIILIIICCFCFLLIICVCGKCEKKIKK